MFKSMDTLAQRYALLKPSITLFGPDDATVRPAVVLFHGCGGLRPHVSVYAQAAALTGVRAYVVDSFAPRGWDRTFATTMICTGAVMQGYERSGDVLAVLSGLKQEGRTDMNNVVLTGFSHGGWSIMDLMTERLTRKGEAKLVDPDPSLADAVRGLFLVYPYINFPARTNFYPWLRKPRVFAVLAERDHLTPYGHSVKIFDKLKTAGTAVETLSLNASHAFDEDTNTGGVMKYDPEAMRRSMEAMLAFMGETIVPVGSPTPA